MSRTLPRPSGAAYPRPGDFAGRQFSFCGHCPRMQQQYRLRRSPREDKDAIRPLRLRARRQQDHSLRHGCRHRPAYAAGRAAGRRRAVGDGDQPRPAHPLCWPAHRAGDIEFSNRPGHRRADTYWGLSRRRTRRRFSPRTARAGICYRPITKAEASRSTASERTARLARRPRSGWPRPPAPTPYKPIAPTGLPLCRTSPAFKTMFWNRQRIIPAQT